MKTGSLQTQPDRRRRFDLPTFVLHWTLVSSVLVSLASGLRIAIDHRAEGPMAAVWQWLHAWLPQGAVFVAHLASAAVLLAALLGYLAFVLLARQQSRWRLTHTGDGARLSGMLRANRLMHWLGLALLLALVITGWGNLSESPVLATDSMRTLHLGLALAVLGYLVLHPLLHLLHGGPRQLLGALSWRRRHVRWLAPAAALGVVASLALFGGEWLNTPQLVAARVAQAPRVDGVIDDPAWRDAASVTLHVKLGNTPQPRGTPVRVQAVRDDQRVYLHLAWPDPGDSRAHLPLVRQADGWRVLHDGFERDDERTYYEDKLALMLSKQGPLSAAWSIHLGPRPLADAPPARHGRGYHYTTDGSVLDLWHWKSARSDPQFQADDNHFRAPETVYGCELRYKAGYQADPNTAGGVKDNWLAFSTETVQPKRLPRSSRFVSLLSDSSSGVDYPHNRMRWVDGYPYRSAQDNLAVGSLIPSILATEPYQGDRGQVGARGRWADGYWHLEMSRAIDTGSPYDVSLHGDTYLWVALFDHVQTRHAYHLRPLRLTLAGES